MNKVWQEPQVMVQPFVANEYVAACYKIRCTTPKNNGRFHYLFNDSNGDGVWDEDDELLYSSTLGFRGCNKWHSGVIQDKAPEANGFVTNRTYSTWPNAQNVSYAVFWWKEDLGSSVNYHSMTPGEENYETNPNAS